MHISDVSSDVCSSDLRCGVNFMSNKSKEETDCYINFNTADGQILKYTLEGYVENVYVSTRDARDALIDMYDIGIETNRYSDADNQILILTVFVTIDRKIIG